MMAFSLCVKLHSHVMLTPRACVYFFSAGRSKSAVLDDDKTPFSTHNSRNIASMYIVFKQGSHCIVIVSALETQSRSMPNNYTNCGRFFSLVTSTIDSKL